MTGYSDDHRSSNHKPVHRIPPWWFANTCRSERWSAFTGILIIQECQSDRNRCHLQPLLAKPIGNDHSTTSGNHHFVASIVGSFQGHPQVTCIRGFLVRRRIL